jgi:hypothetical protein
MKKVLFAALLLITMASCQKEILFDKQSVVDVAQISYSEETGVTSVWLDRVDNSQILHSQKRSIGERAKELIALKGTKALVKFDGLNICSIEEVK